MNLQVGLAYQIEFGHNLMPMVAVLDGIDPDGFVHVSTLTTSKRASQKYVINPDHIIHVKQVTT